MGSKKSSEKLQIGGQAVIEGVMIKSPNYYSVAVRKPNRKIALKAEKLKSIFSSHKIFKIPFIRGVAQLIEMLVLGIKTLTYSADVALEDEKNGKQEKLSNWQVGITLGISFIIAILMFIVAPLYLSGFVVKNNGVLFNLVDGVFRIIIFFVYLLAISMMADVKTLFAYHGAEHKTIYCYEKGADLTVKNVKKFAKEHPRCGTSFIMIVLILSIIVFSLVVTDNFWIKLASRIVLIPIIAGISYEFLKLTAKYEHKPFIKPLLWPGMLIQKITTRNPSDRQIEVAIASVKKVLDMEKKKSKA